jgi:hypothetical protein
MCLIINSSSAFRPDLGFFRSNLASLRWLHGKQPYSIVSAKNELLEDMSQWLLLAVGVFFRIATLRPETSILGRATA